MKRAPRVGLPAVALLVGCGDLALDGATPITRQAFTPTAGIVCGDGHRQDGEQCDDGNLVGGDGCSAECALELLALASEACGTGAVEFPEQCDDFNNLDGDGCSASCTIEPGYTCELVPIEGGFFLSFCTEDACGDGVFGSGEYCDDDNHLSGDGCSDTCLVEVGFYCQNSTAAPSVCFPAVCGDGRIDPPEICDDANAATGDGCGDSCAVEPGFACETIVAEGIMFSICFAVTCGDDAVQGAEECDDGDGNSDVTPDACRSDCTLPRCGDLVEDSAEVCDHGNANGAAGYCDAACAGYVPEIEANEGAYDLVPQFGRVGIIAADADLSPICADAIPDLADFEDLQDLLEHNGFFAGRLGRLTEDVVVENPLLFLREPAPGAIILTGRREDVAPMYGHFMARAGSTVLSPVVSAIGPGRCPCSSGSVFAQDSCNTPTGPAGGTGPCECPTCGDTEQCGDFRSGAALELAYDADLPLEPVGDQPAGPIRGSCDFKCMIAGQVEQCTDPGSVFTPDDGLRRQCLARPYIDPVCLVLGDYGSIEPAGTPASAPPPNCPGRCQDGADCGWLAPVEGGAFDRCQLETSAGDPGPDGSGGACDPTPAQVEEILDDIEDATPEEIWKVCIDNDHPVCVGLDGRREPLEDPDDVDPIFCTAEQQDPAAARQCVMCSKKLGGGCGALDPDSALQQRGAVITRLVDRFFPKPTTIEVNEQARGRSELELKRAELWAARIGQRAGDAPPDASPPEEAADPISIASGELTMEATDVAFPSRAVSFELVRSYRSGAATRTGAFGPGWTHNYEERLEPIGDPFNREGVPSYCVDQLSMTIRCLLHHDGRGGSHMYVLDPESAAYVPLPGATAVIRALSTRNKLDLVEAPAGAIAWIMREPGGITKTFELAGVLLSVKDDKGYGVELDWDLRSVEEVEAEGGWSGVMPTALRPIDRRSVAVGIGFRDRANRLNRLQLMGVVDSYGRRFDFTYETKFADISPVTEDGPYRRSRLQEVRFREQPLVKYEYAELDATNEAYLEKVTRLGMSRDLIATKETVTSYEYQHDVFSTRFGFPGALAVDETPGGALIGLSTFANTVLARLDVIALEIGACRVALHLAIEPDRHACGVPLVPVEGAIPGAFTGVPLFKLMRPFIADNIVRVRRTGGSGTDIELETRFDPDPFSPDFDRVVEQRYGATVQELPAADVVLLEGSLAHRWLTKAPAFSMRQSGTPIGGSLVVDDVPEEILAAAPEVDHDPFVDLPGGEPLPEACEHFDAFQEMPLFAIHDPVGPRVDEDLSAAPSAADMIRRTKAGCPAVAARHARDIFLNDIITLPPEAPLQGMRREALEWDLSLVCRWVELIDRVGATSYRGTNFAGQVLIDAAPSPSGAGYSITKRLFNADGLLIEEVRPDGGRTLTEYDGQDQDPSAPLFRALPTSVVEVAATSPALVPAVMPGRFGLDTAISQRQWTFTYEPLFQRLASATDPNGVTERLLYDYQQLASSDALATGLIAHARRQFMLSRAPDFRGRDLDGDGTNSTEDSSGLVLSFVADVQLGSIVADVGERTRRDGTGRPVMITTISDANDASVDSDAIELRYYEDLEKSEAGDTSMSDQCDSPRGPVAFQIRKRNPGSSDVDDLDIAFFAYDSLGGVRLLRKNEDDATDVITRRNALGQVAEEERPGITLTTSTYDERAQLVRTRIDDLTGEAFTRSSVNAWAAAGVPLGACTEIEEGACETFPDYALAVAFAHAVGEPLPDAPAEASFAVSLLDAEDRVVGAVDAAGGRSDRVLNAAGFPVEESVQAQPTIKSAFSYDPMGRVLRATRGEGGDRLETEYRYDRLGRVADVQTLGPLGDGFVDGEGTISTTRYDRLDRVTLRRVVGDDGRGERRVLAAEYVERNSLGAERFVHRLAQTQPASLPVLPEGEDAGDGWATEELRYDHAMRPGYHAPEGRLFPTTAFYDGFGLVELAGPQANVSTTMVPRNRSREVRRLTVPEGPSAEAREILEISKFDVRGLLQESRVTDLGNGVARISFAEHDGLGQQRRNVDPTGRSVAASYDRAGRVVAVEERSAANVPERLTEYLYDPLGRVVVERPAIDAPETRYDRDRAGRVFRESSGTGAGANIRESAFDSSGRAFRFTTTARRARVTTLAFQPNTPRPETIIVDGLLAKEYVRDGLLRPTSSLDNNLVLPADAISAFRVSRPALTTDITYDTLGRVTDDATIGTFPTTSPTLGGASEHVLALLTRVWGEDFLGPQGVTTLRGDSLGYSYSERGTLGTITRRTDGVEHGVSLSTEGGLWVRARVEGDHSWDVSKVRDAFGFVIGGSLRAISAPSLFGISSDRVLRGPTGRITAERREGPRLGVRVRGFRYDALGRVSEQREEFQSTGSASDFLAHRDAALATEDDGALAVSAPDRIFRTTLTDANAIVASDEDAHRRSFDAQVDDSAAGVPTTDVNGRTISHDTLQRTSDDGALQYTFDAFDRLVLVKRGNREEMRLAYDGLGRRRLERRQMLGGHVEDAVLEYEGANVIEETDAATQRLLVATTHAPGIDAPLVVTIPGRTETPTYILRTNARGDAVAAGDDATGQIVEEADVTAWGEREIASRAGSPCVEGAEGRDGPRRISLPQSVCGPLSKVLGRFGIAGARAHPSTKLVDMRNRVYAPHLRGFLTKDPLGAVDSQALYSYAAGDPVNLRDPWGLEATDSGVSVTLTSDTLEINVFGFKVSLSFSASLTESTLELGIGDLNVTVTTGIGGIQGRTNAFDLLGDAVGGAVGGVVAGIGHVMQDVAGGIGQVTTGLGPAIGLGRQALQKPRDFQEALDPVAGGFRRGMEKFSGADDVRGVAEGLTEATAHAVLLIVGGRGLARPNAAGVPRPQPRACFVAGTLVHTPEGPRAIEALSTGDAVLCRDEQSDETLVCSVEATFASPATQLLVVYTTTEPIVTTNEHPFFVRGRGFIRAADLQPGDNLDSGAREDAVTVIDRVTLWGPATVYNLSVSGSSTYFVGEVGVWVHNKGGVVAPGPSALIKSALEPVNKTGLTEAGRALDKHGNMSRGRSTPFPESRGNVAQKNAVAETQLREILDGGARTDLGRGGIEYRLPDGRGARWDADGGFSGFID